MKIKEAKAVDNQHVQIAKIIPMRTETVLCQYPIHKLSKNKNPVQIALTSENSTGKVETTWKVSPNAEYGHPGILAYKLDALVINRLIDELYPNVPEVIRIAGSLRELSELIGKKKTGDTAKVKNALYQNAFAAITARLEFTGKDKTQRKFEFGATRYSVVFIGEKLPNGETADAICIVLNPLFRDLLRNAKRRPLDYEYLKELPPAAQRWYELVSFQIFAALNLRNRRARYLYSEFCRRAPLVRSFDWVVVHNQMNRIHKPHIESGYVSKIEFEETTDAEGRIDWMMWYIPGMKAKQEYREFNERSQVEERAPRPAPPPRLVKAKSGSGEERAPQRTPEESAIIEKLTSHGIDGSRAVQLVESNRAECGLWAEAWPYQNQRGMENPPAVLATFIERKRRPLPKGYQQQLEREEKARTSNQREALRARYRQEVIKPALEQLTAEWLERFEKDFQELTESANVLLNEKTEKEITSLRIAHFEMFAEENPELSITRFEEWKRAGKLSE